MQELRMTLLLICLILPSTAQTKARAPCADTTTPLEMNECLSEQLSSAEKKLEQYLKASAERFSRDERSINLTDEQKSWLAYREAHCDNVFEYWKAGTVRTAMAIQCRIDLTRERTRTMWTTFLTYPDGRPPLLPAP
jgi:uncharacterized protein YecT (DUF1311 family)